MNRRMKFEHLAVLDLLKSMNGLDLDFGANTIQKIEKNGLVVERHPYEVIYISSIQ